MPEAEIKQDKPDVQQIEVNDQELAKAKTKKMSLESQIEEAEIEEKSPEHQQEEVEIEEPEPQPEEAETKEKSEEPQPGMVFKNEIKLEE